MALNTIADSGNKYCLRTRNRTTHEGLTGEDRAAFLPPKCVELAISILATAKAVSHSPQPLENAFRDRTRHITRGRVLRGIEIHP